MEIARRSLLLGGIAACLPTVAIARADREANAKPLVVLISLPVFSLTAGLESPDFALYANGLVIYRHGQGFKSVQLDSAERDALVRDLDEPSLRGLARHYDADIVTDDSNVTLHFYGPDAPWTLSVYGEAALDQGRGQVPPQIVAAYHRLSRFDHPRATVWSPARIEVVLGAYDPVPPGEQLAWPQGWPDLHDPHTVHWKDGRYSLYLPVEGQAALDRLFAIKAPGQPIRINGKAWGLMPRVPFPGETRWMERRPA